MIVVLSNKDDSRALLLEAHRQRLTDGDFVFFLVQHFEVSETDSPVCLHLPPLSVSLLLPLAPRGEEVIETKSEISGSELN